MGPKSIKDNVMAIKAAINLVDLEGQEDIAEAVGVHREGVISGVSMSKH